MEKWQCEANLVSFEQHAQIFLLGYTIKTVKMTSGIVYTFLCDDYYIQPCVRKRSPL